MSQSILNIQDLSVRYGSKTVLNKLSFTAKAGQSWIIQGESGSGKTTLGKAMAEQIKYEGAINFHFDAGNALPPKVLFVENWYHFTNLEGDRNFYYQQRYNRQQKKETATVVHELELYGKEHSLNNDVLHALLTTFQYSNVLDEQLFELSSGEHKKLQLVKALWFQPQLLIIDQPYTGLDAHSRQVLNKLLKKFIDKDGTLILFSNDTELPSGNHHFITLQEGKAVPGVSSISHQKKQLGPLPDFLKAPPEYISKNLISMKNICVQYGEKQILANVNWEVNAGERWLLQGHNGSGKSTLLSLITADHPQAYANDITLFGVNRNGGVSIWEIKKRMGLISPELHWYFDKDATVLQSIASAFFDSNGLYQQLRYKQKQELEELLRFLDLYDVKDELLSVLPLGKQRLTLLGRTIIKNQQLLVLDEPCQGLDQRQTQYFNSLVDEISKNGVTLIYVGHFETQLPSCITHKLILENGHVISYGGLPTGS